jgi:tricorn protease-like protein
MRTTFGLFGSRRDLLRFVVVVGLSHTMTTCLAFALDDPPVKSKTVGRIVTATTFQDDQRNWIVAFDPETTKWEKITPAGGYGYVRISPDGRTIAFGSGSGLWTCPLKPGAKPTKVGEIGDPKRMQETDSASIAWEPDGKGLIATGARGEFPDLKFETFRFDAQGKGRRKVPIPHDTDGIEDISPDGRWLLTGREIGAISQGLFRIRADGTGEVQVTRGSYGGRFSPDGSKILYVRSMDGGEGQGVFVIDADGRHRRRLFRFAAVACWSPDGTRIAVTGVSAPPMLLDEAGKAPPDNGESKYENRIVLVDLEGKERGSFLTPSRTAASQPDWR